MKLKIAATCERTGASIVISNRVEKKTKCRVMSVRVNDKVEVATRNGWLCFWIAGREVRLGPLTTDQAEKLVEDLEYDALT